MPSGKDPALVVCRCSPLDAAKQATDYRPIGRPSESHREDSAFSGGKFWRRREQRQDETP